MDKQVAAAVLAIAIIVITAVLASRTTPTIDPTGDAKACGTAYIVEQGKDYVCIAYTNPGWSCKPNCMRLDCVADAEKSSC